MNAKQPLNQQGREAYSGQIKNFSKERYISTDWYAREWRAVWAKSWIAAVHVSDLTDAGDYVVFDLGRVLFKKVPKSIRYTWSSSLPKGKEMSKFFGNQKIVVVGSGSRGTGGWKTFRRDIVEDYKRLFGDDPPETPLAILVLSDGDNTDSVAEADYDDIMLLPD